MQSADLPTHLLLSTIKCTEEDVHSMNLLNAYEIIMTANEDCHSAEHASALLPKIKMVF